jgi:putative pyruvate formate lyase activating enzyme
MKELPSVNFEKCTLCPRKCGADRKKGVGLCGAGEKIKIARAALHFYEEPCISGKEGSGTVFFSGCPLGCVFCQNAEISSRRKGREISKEEFQGYVFSLKEQGANNVNLVTPCHFAPQIRDALLPIKEALGIPIAVNTGSYDTPLQLSFFEGLADIYMPDFKFQKESGASLAKAPDYPEIALSAITEMVRQVGRPVFDDRGMLKKGVIVRHLVLPGKRKESMEILRLLRERFSPDDLLLSLMSQYTPMPGVPKELDRTVTSFEYDSVMRVAEELGFEGFFQQRSSAGTKYIPEFDLF